jgi:hypothetical protein
MPQDGARNDQQESGAGGTTSASDAGKNESKKLEEKSADTKVKLGALEEDDEFEDFPAEGKEI